MILVEMPFWAHVLGLQNRERAKTKKFPQKLSMLVVNILRPEMNNEDYVIFRIFTNFPVISATDHSCLSPADMRVVS